MRVSFHPAVQRDVSAILRYYDGVSSRLGDDFWAELTTCIERAAQHPERCHPVDAVRRRVNLPRFPYHFLFRIKPDGIRIMAVRHHKQHPRTGLLRY
ncbi:MAG: hypothetical protein B9S33_20395 [Pedosphaera sp. Tous-C6FEB]|nr:MAG: hypothetical protein B9S33_20395 [Pedosphaera sp. Tous-C6FEB]